MRRIAVLSPAPSLPAVLLVLGAAILSDGCRQGKNGSQDLAMHIDAAMAPVDPGNGPADVSVVQHHKNASRDGLYIAPTLTRAAVRTLQIDPSLDVALTGSVYAQPLFLAGTGTAVQPDLVFVATEDNRVYAIRADTGAITWMQRVGDPVLRGNLPCGGIDPLGITGTPVVDRTSRTIFFDAMTTPDGGQTTRHLIFGLSVDTGSIRPGWPIDVGAQVQFQGTQFQSYYQNQRGALALSQGVLYVPYGGHLGDCGDYHGWLVGVPIAANGSPGTPHAWATGASGGGAWGPGGPSADAAGVYLATGNTSATTDWNGGEAILRFSNGPVFSGKTTDYFAPTNWLDLDNADLDIGGSAPVLLQVPGATPANYVLGLGKDGNAYLLDHDNLGGISAGTVTAHVAAEEIVGAAAAYQTGSGTYVTFRAVAVNCPMGLNGRVTTLHLAPAAPGTPAQITTAWCGEQTGLGSPMVSTVDGRNESVVWVVGAEGDNGVHAFNGETGEPLVTVAAPDAMTFVRRFQTLIIARGRLLVAADARLYALAPAP